MFWGKITNNLKKYGLLFLTTLFLIAVCIFAAQYEKKQISGQLASIRLEDGEIVRPWYSEKENAFYYFLPSYSELEKASFVLSNEVLEIDDEKYADGDLLCGLVENKEYKATNLDTMNEKSFVIKKSDNIGAVFVKTATGSMKEVFQSKKHKELAHIKVFDNSGSVDTFESDSVIKGRGNSTWYSTKKSFSILFNDRISILGMGDSDKYVLFSGSVDNSLMRNKLVYDVARKVGAVGTPDSEYVDLYLNGEYYGLYLLSQSPETWYQKDNVDSEGLYLFTAELMEREKNSDYAIYVQEGESIVTVCLPEKLSDEETIIAKEIVHKTDEKILSQDEDIDNIIDIDSWAKRYLLDEVFENYDAGMASSYFYTSINSGDNKVYAGPIWDYDNSMANLHGYCGPTLNPEILFAKNVRRGNDSQKVLWYSSLYDNSVFYNRMVDIFEQQFVSALEELLEREIYDIQAEIKVAKDNNSIRWGKDSADEVEYIREYLSKRLVFLKELWVKKENYCVVKASRPDEIDSLYTWFYIKKGHSVSESEYFEKLLEDAQWYDESSGEKFDFDKPITEDVYLTNVSSRYDVIGDIRYQIKREKKIAVIIISVITMYLCGLILYTVWNKRKGNT